MSFQSLKFKIAGNLALIVFISVAFSDLIIIGIIQKNLIQDRIANGKTLVADFPAPLRAEPFRQMESGNTSPKGYPPSLVFLKIRLKNEEKFPYGHPIAELESEIQQLESRTLAAGKGQIEFFGNTLGVFGPQKKYVVISAPFPDGSQNQTGVKSAVFQLADIYDVLRDSQKPIVFYGIANFLVLVMFGVYRLSRLVIRPIHRFIKMTDDYREKDRLYFTHGRNHQEFNQLSKALNHMLDVIETDKENLRHSLGELEKANAELKTAQKEIIKAEKLASVGRLSAGIAHEIGNPISILLGYLDLLHARPGLQKDETAQDYVRRMQSEVHRIHQIIRQLLDFSRNTQENPEIVAIHELVRDVIAMMSVQPLLQHIVIVFQPGETPDAVWIDRDKMRQVLINVIINAADSIKASTRRQNGEILITTELVPEKEGSALSHQPTILLKIADNGCGIAEKDLHCVFDPFYTTKSPGKGTGLGLAVSYMIIDQAGGRMMVETRPGEGACILIYLPLRNKSNPRQG